MPTNVDSLSIQISAEAKNAEASLNKLVSKLDALSASLGRINSSNFSTFSANIEIYRLQCRVCRISKCRTIQDLQKVSRN